MIRSVYYSKDGLAHQDLDKQQMADILQQDEGLLWVSLERFENSELEGILEDVFHFHPLAVEDCMSTGYQTPKVDDFGTYIFLILHAIEFDPETGQINAKELNLFLGKNYLVTCYHTEDMPPVDLIWKRLARDERLRSNGADFLCHGLIDVMVDDYTPMVDRMEDEIEYLEDEVLEKPEKHTLDRLIDLKHATMNLRRMIAPEREVINRLSRGDFQQINGGTRIYFRDVYDHIVRIQEMSDSIRDMATGAMDIYLNSTSLRLNEVMKALTVVSTIFLPLTFLTGLYGMNFTHMPELGWRYGYLMVWGLFILVVVVMMVYFKKKNWF